MNGNNLAAKAARIDLDADEAAAEEGEWELVENYAGAEEGETEWVIRAKEEDMHKVAGVLEQAVEKAQAATHGESNQMAGTNGG
jgi:hypothetical protein